MSTTDRDRKLTALGNEYVVAMALAGNTAVTHNHWHAGIAVAFQWLAIARDVNGSDHARRLAAHKAHEFARRAWQASNTADERAIANEAMTAAESITDELAVWA